MEERRRGQLDLTSFQSFVIEELTPAPNVDTVRTALNIRQVKDEGPIALEDRCVAGLGPELAFQSAADKPPSAFALP